jgi:hypothetical protein
MSEIEYLSSPFDAIRREDGYGEFWTGRELMPVMGYGADWRNFVEAIERGKAACVNAKHDPRDHIGDATKMVPIGSGAHRAIGDYRLTRFGAYLVAMNGDPHKKEIAEAQTYFTVRTRQAELAEEPDELEIARRYVKAIEDKRAAIARAEKAEVFKRAIEAGDGLTLRSFHKKYFSTTPERVFFDHLYARGILINQRGKGPVSKRTGEPTDGRQHRHPSAKGKEWLYLHAEVDRYGKRQENTRVRPGDPELAFRDKLASQGLAPNEEPTALFELEAAK